MAAPELKPKPSGIWIWEFTDETGARRRISTKTRDKAKANAMGRDIILGLSPKTSTQPSRSSAGQVTMKELFDRAERTVWSATEVKSQATVRSNVKILTGMVGHVPIREMTYTRLEQLVDELRAKGYAPGTIKRKMDAVSKALRMATRWTDERGRPLLDAKPTMPTIRVSNLKDRVLDWKEQDQVFAAIERRRQLEPGRQWSRFRDLIVFLLDTGARLGEALMIGPKDVEVTQGQHYITFARYRTKSDKPRTVPLTPAVVEALGRRGDDLGLVDDQWVFFPLNNGTAWYMWSNIRDDLKPLGFDIGDVTLHTLRHTCLTRLAQGGMQLLQLQKWAGHSDPKITAERYVHLTSGDLIGGLDILKGSTGGRPTSVIFTEAAANRDGPATQALN